MHVDHTDSQKALRRELRAYFSELMTPEIREATRGNEGGATYKQVIRQLGKDGWLALGWPKEYGGQGRPSSEQLVFFEEAQLAEVPLPFVTISTQNRRRLIALCYRLHRAGRRHRPRIAENQRGARRRSLRDQRQQDLDEQR